MKKKLLRLLLFFLFAFINPYGFFPNIVYAEANGQGAIQILQHYVPPMLYPAFIFSIVALTVAITYMRRHAKE